MWIKIHKQRITVLLFLRRLLFRVFYAFLLNRTTSLLLSWELINSASVFFSFRIILDKVRLSFRILVTYVSFCVFIFSRNYISTDPFYWRFTLILLAFVLSINLLIFSGSLLLLLIGWDGLGITSFALIIYYERPYRLKAGFLTVLINRIGDILIMTIIFYYVILGRTLLINYNPRVCLYILWLLRLAAMTKRAQYPFSVWLPAAIAAPTPVRALVHSSTLVTAGIYILIRALLTIPITEGIRRFLLIRGAVTSLLGGICAIQENDLKKIIAFSTLRQLGVIVFCLGLGSPHLALLHLFTHAIFKAILFIVAGLVLILAYGVQDIRLLGGVCKINPLIIVFLNTSTLCLVGLPFLASYYSKHTILSLILIRKLNLFAVFIILRAVLLTGFYIIRLLKIINWGLSVVILKGSPFSSFFFYLPCFFLYLGRLSLGLLLNRVDFSYLRISFYPKVGIVLIEVLGPLRLILGIFIFGFAWKFITNIWFLSPFWEGLPSVLFPIRKLNKEIEQRWFEPYRPLHKLNKWINLINSLLWWPKLTLGYVKYSLLLLLIIRWMFLN